MVIICLVVLLHGIRYVEQYSETFTADNNCRIVGSYVIEKCGDEIKGYMKVPDATQVQTTEVPKMLPLAKSEKNCPFPLEPHDKGCQLKCPTSTYLLANPNVVCQRIISGEIVSETEGQCPEGYRADPAGCVKILTSCPANYELIEGTCHERCPDGSQSEFVEADVDHDGFVEKKNIRVCRAKPVVSK